MRAIFICLATEAVHIELVSDLTTDIFVAALDGKIHNGFRLVNPPHKNRVYR